MSDLQCRLREIREQEQLSLREFADRLERRAGFSVAHDSVRRYESGERRVPTDYLAAVCDAFGMSSRWLLFGEGARRVSEPSRVDEAMGEIEEIIAALRGDAREDPETVRRRARRTWERFLEGHQDHPLVRSVILESGSRAAAVEPDRKGSRLPRVPDAERENRRRRSALLIETARPHMRWLSLLCADSAHVVYVTDADGIVLESMGSSTALVQQWHLVPGADWSEEAMGTNGAGTALRSDRPVAVIGPEHFSEAFHDAACLAAPIHDSAGVAIGAIDLSTRVEGADPERLLAVAYAAEEIEREMMLGAEPSASLIESEEGED